MGDMAMKKMIVVLMLAGAEADVSCGSGGRASSCGMCPPGDNPKQVWKWCNGECTWDETKKVCGMRSEEKLDESHRNEEGYLPSQGVTGAGTVNCGKVRAASCAKCPPASDPKQVWKWCNGDCSWN